MSVATVRTGVLTLGCADLDAMPLFSRIDGDGHRDGYEPDAARVVAGALGLELRWEVLTWADFYPAIDEGRVDGVWCGQGITDTRRALADFTSPYAIFDESLVVREGVPGTAPDDLAGLRIGAIEGSTNMALAETFPGVELVPFPGTADVLGDMTRATADGTVDGFVDDDVVMVPLGERPGFRLVFTLPTRNRWGVAVRRGNDALRTAIDAALAAGVADGSLRRSWERHMPWLAFPL